MQEVEQLDHVDLNLLSTYQELLKNVIFFLITNSPCKAGIHVKHSGCKRCLGITWLEPYKEYIPFGLEAT